MQLASCVFTWHEMAPLTGRRPAHPRTVSSSLTRRGTPRWQVTSRKDQEQYWHGGSRPYEFITAEALAGQFRCFSVGRQIAADLAKPPPQAPLGSTKHGDPEVRAPFLPQSSHRVCGLGCMPPPRFGCGCPGLGARSVSDRWLLSCRDEAPWYGQQRHGADGCRGPACDRVSWCGGSTHCRPHSSSRPAGMCVVPGPTHAFPCMLRAGRGSLHAARGKLQLTRRLRAAQRERILVQRNLFMYGFRCVLRGMHA